MREEILLIELNTSAEGYYSGSKYSETVFITPSDYSKYLKNGEEITEETVLEDWEDVEVCLGELDGKHSEVYGEVDKDFWTREQIAEYWEKPDNTGEEVLDELIYKVIGLNADLSYQEVKQSILDNVQKVLDGIDIKKIVTVKIPADKVQELLDFVDKLNGEK